MTRTTAALAIIAVVTLTLGCESDEHRLVRERYEQRIEAAEQGTAMVTSLTEELTAELSDEWGATADDGCPALEELPGITMVRFTLDPAEDQGRREAEALARQEAFQRRLPAERCLCLQGAVSRLHRLLQDDLVATERATFEELSQRSQRRIENYLMAGGLPDPIDVDLIRNEIEDWQFRRHSDWTGGDPDAQWRDQPFGWNEYGYRPAARMTPPSTAPMLTELRWRYQDYSCDRIF